jgi:dihydrofolate reductase
MLVTLDGFIAGPNGELGSFDVDDEMMQFANRFVGAADAILFGRVAYEEFVAYWDALDPTDRSIPEGEIGFANVFRNMTRIVFSRTLDRVEGNAILIKENIAEEVSKLKQQPGRDLILICGPELLSTFIQLGLIDEYKILVCPVALGEGKPLFRDIEDVLQLRLLRTRVFNSGAVLLDYEPVQSTSEETGAGA